MSTPLHATTIVPSTAKPALPRRPAPSPIDPTQPSPTHTLTLSLISLPALPPCSPSTGQAYEESKSTSAPVKELLPTIARAAVDNKLDVDTFRDAPTPALIDKLLNAAKVPEFQQGAASRVLEVLAACGGDNGGGNGSTKRGKPRSKRPPVLNAYHKDAQSEVQRLNPSVTFTKDGISKTVPGVKSTL